MVGQQTAVWRRCSKRYTGRSDAGIQLNTASRSHMQNKGKWTHKQPRTGARSDLIFRSSRHVDKGTCSERISWLNNWRYYTGELVNKLNVHFQAKIEIKQVRVISMLEYLLLFMNCLHAIHYLWTRRSVVLNLQTIYFKLIAFSHWMQSYDLFSCVVD